MLRTILAGAIRTATIRAGNQSLRSCAAPQQRSFTSLNSQSALTQFRPTVGPLAVTCKGLLQLPAGTTSVASTTTTRSVTKFSLVKGKRKSVKAVLKRFKRLDWGSWIRTYTGRHKKLFKKSAARKRRLRQHVFTNSTQSWLLDKMVTNFWRRPKHYIDDPYAPYHRRDEYFATKGKTFKV